MANFYPLFSGRSFTLPKNPTHKNKKRRKQFFVFRCPAIAKYRQNQKEAKMRKTHPPTLRTDPKGLQAN
jgi:phosphopantothenoylcysteine synthetase/decarboxylase